MSRLPVCSAMLMAVSAAFPAYAIETELNLNTYLAGSMRQLDSDFEASEDDLEGTNNASRVNLNGSVKNEYGKLFAVYERGLRNDKNGIEQVRQVYAGIDTGYGQLVGGKKASEYRLVGERLDPFYDTSVVGFNGRAHNEGASYGLSNLTNGFSRNMVAYSTPMLFDRVQVNGAAFINDKNAPNDKTDYSFGGRYAQPGLEEGSLLAVGAQYLKIENAAAFAAGNPARNELLAVGGSPGPSDSVRVYAAYTAPKYSLAVSLEQIDVDAEPEARQYLYVAGTYAVAENTRMALSYGRLEFKAGSPALSGDGVSFGVFQKLCKYTNAYVAARKVYLDGPGDTSSIAVGLSVNLDAKLLPTFSVSGPGFGPQ